MIDGTAESHAAELETDGAEFVSEAAQYRAGFAQRLRAHWGPALDLHEIIVEIIEQAGRHFSARKVGHSGNRDLLLDVLVQLNGQAIRVAREVHTLLSAGFPLGALSLARTIHEISVRAAVLAKFGVQDEHEDLAEKFVSHDTVDNFKDAEIYQRDAETLGYEPFSDDHMAELRQERDHLVQRFGKAYASTYGWASGLRD